MQGLNLKIKGLYTYPNPLSEVPEGALEIADNVVIDSESVATSRRGFNRLTYGFTNPAHRAHRYTVYQSKILVNYGTTHLAYYDTSTGWVDFSGTFQAPDTLLSRMKFVEASSNLYFTSSSGIRKLDAYNATPSNAGGLKALDAIGSLTGSSGFMTANVVLSTTGNTTSGSNSLASLASTAGIAIGQQIAGTGIPVGTTVLSISGSTVTMSANATATGTGIAVTFGTGSQVAYRIVWGIKDANSNLILGNPSQRAIVANATGLTRDVSLVITVPSGATTAHFFQIYRSGLSATSATEPSDELSLVYEGNPTSGQITAKSITLTDSTPDALRGASLYTNPSQQGILQQNEPPPLAKDVTEFKGSLFYANTSSKMRKIFTLLAVGGASGLQSADTITIAGVTYTAGASENVGTLTFALATTGTASQNITDTANSLVRVINQNASNTTIYAYYLSGYNELPGKILLEERALGGASWALSSNRGAAFNPQLPTSGTSVSSANDIYKNGVFISKTSQPEAVPLTNVLFCGSAGDDIRRIVPLRDSLFVLKANDGIYRILGEDPTSFRRELFDSSTHILAPETAVVLNNQIWCLSDQGVVAISDTGVQVKSRPIEGDLLALFGANLDAVKQLSFAVAYETERKFVLFTISNAGDTAPTQAFVFNLFTNTWTRWPLSKTAGFVSKADNTLYLGDAVSQFTNVERKSYSNDDFYDEGTTYNISAFSAKTITLDTVVGISIGDLLYQSATVKSVVTAVDPVTSSVTVNDTLTTWTVAACTIYTAINCVVQWAPYTAGNPGVQKHFSEVSMFFSTNKFTSASIGFFSELSPSLENIPITGSGAGAWGLFPWGSNSWGGSKPPRPFRVYVPLEKQRCSQLNIRFTHRVARSTFALDGLSVRFDTMSTEVAV